MKLVVPIMPTSLEDVQALDTDRFDSVDIIEWRADYSPKKEDIIALAPAIFEKFAGREIIRVRTLLFSLCERRVRVERWS